MNTIVTSEFFSHNYAVSDDFKSFKVSYIEESVLTVGFNGTKPRFLCEQLLK
jgi:hypothetical protein